MLYYLKNQKPILLIELHPMFVKDPIKKLTALCQTLDIYDTFYGSDLKEIDIESFSIWILPRHHISL